jgi:RNA polymerase sporulation-specific sigma factor
MNKYKGLVIKEAKAMYLFGGENDDLIQEGMIGLFKAIQNYDLNQESSFFSFAKLCISRQMYSAIEASKRKKHSPLNSYVSFYEDSEEGRMIDTIEAGAESNPEQLFLGKEWVSKLEKELDEQLSTLEKRVLYLHLMGTNYKTIASLIDKSPKTVDNALQRIKAKAEKIINSEKE